MTNMDKLLIIFASWLDSRLMSVYYLIFITYILHIMFDIHEYYILKTVRKQKQYGRNLPGKHILR